MKDLECSKQKNRVQESELEKTHAGPILEQAWCR